MINILSILIVISFVIILTLLIKRRSDTKDFNDEVKHEIADVDCLQNKMLELEAVLKSDKTPEQKFEDIENITIYCKGYLSGIKEHMPHQKIYI